MPFPSSFARRSGRLGLLLAAIALGAVACFRFPAQLTTISCPVGASTTPDTSHGDLISPAGESVCARAGRVTIPASSAGIDALSASTLVLYPGRGARLLTADYLAPLARPLTLLVPDGNWNQTKNMMRRVPMLCGAQPVKLKGPSLDHTPLASAVTGHHSVSRK